VGYQPRLTLKMMRAMRYLLPNEAKVAITVNILKIGAV
jgi:hypothetical protein